MCSEAQGLRASAPVGCRSCRASSTPLSACSRRSRWPARSRPESCSRLAEVLDKAGFALPRGLGRRRLRHGGQARRREPVGADPGAEGPDDDAARAGAARPLPRRLAAGGIGLRAPVRLLARPRTAIDVFRLHDPLNDVSNLREAGEAIVDAGKEFHAGLVYSPGDPGAMDQLVEQAKELPDLGATRALVHDPSGGARAAPGRRARRTGQRGVGPARRLLLPGRGRQRPRRLARGGARRRRPDRLRDLSARALAPPRRRRVARVRARRDGPRHGRRRRPALGGVRPRRRAHRRRARDAARAAARGARGRVRPADRARRGARHPPARPRRRRPAARDARGAPGDPPRDRLAAARGPDRPDPRLAGADPRPLRAPLRHRRRRVPGARPGRLRHGRPARSTRPSRRAVALLSDGVPLEDDPPTAEDVRAGGRGARGERGGARPARALRRGGRGAAADDPRAPHARRLAARRRSRRRASSGSASSSGSCRRAASPRWRSRTRGCASPCAGPTSARRSSLRPLGRGRRVRAAGRAGARAAGVDPGRVADGRRLLPRRPSPGTPPFVEVGDVVAPGQTLCLLEAMKLFNELKSERDGPRARDPRRERQAGRVRAAPVRARADRRAAGRL